MERRYQVFLSSTYEDLKNERQEVIQALLELGCMPAGMELFPARDEESWSLITRVIDDSDYYVVIVGGRYGSVDASGTGYTEREYDYAMSRRVPVLAFLRDLESIPSDRREENTVAQSRVAAFRAKILSHRTARPWKSGEGLAGTLSRSLGRIMDEEPREGWVRSRYVRDEILSEGAFLRHLRQSLARSQREVLVSCIPKEWVFNLAFTLIVCRSRGVSMSVVVDASDLLKRYRFLQLLGCSVLPIMVSSGRVPFSGVVVDSAEPLDGSAICRSTKPGAGVLARAYHWPHDSYAISACGDAIRRLMSEAVDAATDTTFQPAIVRTSEEAIISKLRNVPLYRTADIEYVDGIDIDLTRPIHRTVSAAKVAQARELITHYEMNGWQLFDPVAATLSSGEQSLLVPPIIERRDGDLHVAEGHSRLFVLRSRGIKVVRAVVVSGVDTPPPGEVGSWTAVKERDDRAVEIRREYSRHIESQTHPNLI
jgi:hypothetical protein